MHPARADSGRIIPHTTRTEADPEGRDLPASRWSPPTRTCSSPSSRRELQGDPHNEISPDQVPYLAQADKVAILIDGKLLADLNERPFAITPPAANRTALHARILRKRPRLPGVDQLDDSKQSESQRCATG